VKPSYSILLRLAIFVPALLVLASVAMLVKSWNRSADATDLVTHTHKVQAEIQGLLSELREVASAQRGFAVTGNTDFLGHYPQAEKEVRARLNRLEALIHEYLLEHPELPLLRPLVEQHLALAATSIDLTRLGEDTSRAAALTTGRGQRLMDELRTMLDRMSHREANAMAVRLEELSRSTSNQRGVAAGIIAVQIALGLALALTAQKFTNLRQLVTMCAWTKKIKYQGQWLTLEEYLAVEHHVDVTHGISPEEAAKHVPARFRANAISGSA
jgi:CHASE3 domain sensor protein